MKNKLFYVRPLVVVFVTLLTVGCHTSPQPTIGVTFSNEGDFGVLTYLPVRNFESLGLVFTQVELQRVERLSQFGSPRGFAFEGDAFTYHGLLREAHKLGADSIINVTIDMVARDTGTTWYGSALAIRYTDILPPGTPIQAHSRWSTVRNETRQWPRR